MDKNRFLKLTAFILLLGLLVFSPYREITLAAQTDPNGAESVEGMITFHPDQSIALSPQSLLSLASGTGKENVASPLAVIGPVDSRVRVTNTTVAPFSAVVDVIFLAGGNGSWCSGAVIAPMYVLTAAHCLYSAGSFHSNFVVIPGENGASQPYGTVGVSAAFVPSAWVASVPFPSSVPNWNYDWGVLRLSAPVSSSIQPFALSNYPDATLLAIANFTNAGYPGDKCRYPDGTVRYCIPPFPPGTTVGDTQWTATGPIFSNLLTTFLIGNQIDVFGGQSGSPLYFVAPSLPLASRNIITGVLSHDFAPNSCRVPGVFCPTSSYNNFRRVTVDMLEALNAIGVPFVNPSCVQINLAVSGSGTASKTPDRSPGCRPGTNRLGTVISLSAVAAPGNNFSNWIGAAGGLNTTYTVTAPATITAVFVAQPTPPANTVLQRGIYDERNPNITFSGGWTQFNGAGPYANTLTYTNVQNAIAQFAINGDTLILYRTLASNRGNMEVCIGTSCQTVSNNSATIQWNIPVTFNLGSVATRIVRIRNLSTSYIDLDRVEVRAPAVALPAGLHQQDNPNITYQGVWTTYSSTTVNGGSLIYSNTPTAQVNFQINGDALTLYRTRASNRGPMQVCIDTPCYTLNNTTAALQWNVPHTFLNLGTGVHNVVIRNLSSNYIDLDAVRVGSTPAALGAGTYDERDSRIIYNGLWYAYNGAGPLAGTLMYNNTPNDEIRFRFTGQAFRLYRTTAANRGPMQVCVDGTCQTINNNSAAVLWSVPVLISTPTSTTHSVVIRHIGTAAQYIDLDRIVVYSTTPPA
jgi:V8-like Glu-specific endopeptidase